MQADVATCARCGAAFHCGLNDTGPCWCAALSVHGVTLATLAEAFAGCLCPACLHHAATPGNNCASGAAAGDGPISP